MKKELTLTKVRKMRNLEKITQYIMACRASGMRCKDWCRENNIALTTYYGWQRRVFDAAKAEHEVEFAELKPAVEPAVNTVASITSGKVTVNLYCGIDSATVTAIVNGISDV